MSLGTAHDNLVTQLQADADLTAWASTHFGKALTSILGNVPVSIVRPSEMPALVSEIGDGQNAPLGGDTDDLDAQASLPIAVIWAEQDPAAAFAQRKALPELLIRAVRADATLGGAVDDAWVSDWESDKSVNQPKHMMRATVQVRYLIG